MNKSALRATAIAAIIGLAISMLLLVISFVLPELCVKRLCKRAMPLVDAATNAVYNEDYAAVTQYTLQLYSTILDYEGKLVFFSHHKDISSLLNSADSAVHLSYVNDDAQLLEELSDLRYLLDYLVHINEISIENVI